MGQWGKLLLLKNRGVGATGRAHPALCPLLAGQFTPQAAGREASWGLSGASTGTVMTALLATERLQDPQLWELGEDTHWVARSVGGTGEEQIFLHLLLSPEV